MANYIKVNSDGTQARAFTEVSVVSVNTSATKVNVSNVAELEAAVAAQTAGQFIVIAPGEYQLTASLTIPMAADGGGLIGEGSVVITGAALIDQAVLIAHTTSTGTFEYTFAGALELEGGSNKIALKITNGSTTQKTIIYFRNSAHCIDNGSGIALSCVSTGTGAMRMYVNGEGQGFDTINITPATANDRFIFTNVSIDKVMVIAATPDVAAHYFFSGCRLKHEGITGGGAASIKSAAYCWTEAAADNHIPVVLDTNDFTGAATEVLLQGS